LRDYRTRGSLYFAEHVNFNAVAHVFAGLGIAWLVSLFWYYAIHPLVAGAVFLVASIGMHIHAIRHG